MRQGRASKDGNAGWKRDPLAKAVNVKGVSQIGESLGNHITERRYVLSDVAKGLHAGRGFNSPLGERGTPGVGVGRTIHKSGSQGSR